MGWAKQTRKKTTLIVITHAKDIKHSTYTLHAKTLQLMNKMKQTESICRCQVGNFFHVLGYMPPVCIDIRHLIILSFII